MLDETKPGGQDTSQAADSSGQGDGGTSSDAGAKDAAQKELNDRLSAQGRENKALRDQVASLISERDAATTTTEQALARANEIGDQFMEMRREGVRDNPDALRLFQQEDIIRKRENAVAAKEAEIARREATSQAAERTRLAAERSATINRVAAKHGVDAASLETFGVSDEGHLEVLAKGMKAGIPAALGTPAGDPARQPNDPQPDPLTGTGDLGVNLTNEQMNKLAEENPARYREIRGKQDPRHVQITN